MFYIFIFINTIFLILAINSLIHLLWNKYNFDKDYITRYTTGRIVDFKTGESKTQYGPAKSL